MSTGRSGKYAYANGVMNYDVCMLDGGAMHGFYRDPYLSAIKEESNVPNTILIGEVWMENLEGPWFTSYETHPRWMCLAASNTAIRSVPSGLQLRAPYDAKYAEAFSSVCKALGIQADLLLNIPQVNVDGRQLDTTDRVQAGAALVRELVRMGL